MFCDNIYLFWKCIVWICPKNFMFSLQNIFLMTHFLSNNYCKYSWHSLQHDAFFNLFCCRGIINCGREGDLIPAQLAWPSSPTLTNNNSQNTAQHRKLITTASHLQGTCIHLWILQCQQASDWQSARWICVQLNKRFILTYKSVFSRMRE